jgi:hypothetical protein
MSPHSEAITLVQSLNSLSSQLSIENNSKIRKEALRLSKRPTETLGGPDNIVVELEFSVRCTHLKTSVRSKVR